MANVPDAFDVDWAASIKPATRERIDDYIARYQAGEDMNDPTGRGSLDGEEMAILERLHPDVVAEMRADADEQWAATIDPSTRSRIDDYVARYQAGDDMNDPTGRGSLDADEMAILERLHPDVVADMRADADEQWAATIDPSTRSKIDDYVARYQAGDDMNDPTGRGQLDGDEMAILERLHPDVVAEMRADADEQWAATIDPSTRARIDDYIARYEAGEDMNDPTGRGSLDGEEMAILERLHPDVVADMRADAGTVVPDPVDAPPVDAPPVAPLSPEDAAAAQAALDASNAAWAEEQSDQRFPNDEVEGLYAVAADLAQSVADGSVTQADADAAWDAYQQADTAARVAIADRAEYVAQFPNEEIADLTAVVNQLGAQAAAGGPMAAAVQAQYQSAVAQLQVATAAAADPTAEAPLDDDALGLTQVQADVDTASMQTVAAAPTVPDDDGPDPAAPTVPDDPGFDPAVEVAAVDLTAPVEMDQPDDVDFALADDAALDEVASLDDDNDGLADL